MLTHAIVGRRHFASEKMPAGSNLIVVAVAVVSLLYLGLLWTADVPLWPMVAGIVGELASLWLFLATVEASRAGRLKLAFDPELPKGVVMEGPYRHVRHPFYTSYLIFWSSWAIGTWSLAALAPLLLIVAIYIVAAKSEERNFANSALAGDYDVHRQRTGLFWPKLFR